jgi:diacylglycerol O-acyltransferase
MPQRLSALDSVFLNFESEREPMHVGALYIFEGKSELRGRPGVIGLFQTVEERLNLIPRYRQRIQNVPAAIGHPVWVDDPQFDLAYHLRRLALPKPGGTSELLDVVARLHSRILDRARPLWEMYIIEGLAGGRVAIYAKTHHAMVDGVAAVDLATTVFDFDPRGWRAPAGEPFRPRPLLSPQELVGDVVKEAAGALRGMAGSILRSPTRTPMQLAGQALHAVQARELLPVLRPVPTGPLNVKVGGARRIELASIALPRVKAIKNAFGVTVNDVALTVVGEAIHIFLEHRGEAIPDDLTYRIMVPVSVRNDAEKSALGNRVSAMFLDMPVEPTPVSVSSTWWFPTCLACRSRSTPAVLDCWRLTRCCQWRPTSALWSVSPATTAASTSASWETAPASPTLMSWPGESRPGWRTWSARPGRGRRNQRRVQLAAPGRIRRRATVPGRRRRRATVPGRRRRRATVPAEARNARRRRPRFRVPPFGKPPGSLPPPHPRWRAVVGAPAPSPGSTPRPGAAAPRQHTHRDQAKEEEGHSRAHIPAALDDAH